MGLNGKELMVCSDDDGVEFVIVLFCKLGKKLHVVGDTSSMKPKPGPVQEKKEELEVVEPRPGKKQKLDNERVCVIEDGDNIKPIESE
jgi:hypothetical protein